MIRIAFIISGLGTGGAEMMLFKVVERLDRQRFDPYVISLTTSGDFGPRIAALGIPLVVVGMKPGRLSPFGIFSLVQILKRVDPDVVHTWLYHADLLGGLAARLAGISKIGWCLRNSTLDKNKTKCTTHIVVKLCALLSHRLPSKILSCSEKARQVHEALGYSAEKMVVVPNGIDLTRFKRDAAAKARVSAELGVAIHTPLVGLVGRFDPQKNHEGFFEAAAALHRRMPAVNFVLAGFGVDLRNAPLMQTINQAGLRDKTHLLGLREDIPDLMSALDVLVSTSAYGEAFPNVLGEAMACGVLCVVTDVGDSACIVGNTGRVVAVDDMQGLADAVYELLTLPSSERSKLSDAARARVSEHFEIAAVVGRYEDFYENLAANG